jgi:hypothetical protein
MSRRDYIATAEILREAAITPEQRAFLAADSWTTSSSGASVLTAPASSKPWTPTTGGSATRSAPSSAGRIPSRAGGLRRPLSLLAASPVRESRQATGHAGNHPVRRRYLDAMAELPPRRLYEHREALVSFNNAYVAYLEATIDKQPDPWRPTGSEAK